MKHKYTLLFVIKTIMPRGKKRCNRVDSFSDLIAEEEDYTPGNEYFQVDSRPLQDELVISLSERLDLDISDVREIVSETFVNISDLMVDDYFSAKPTNNQWKLGTNKNKIRKIEPQLNKIRKEMEDEKPTLLKIMESPITTDDRKLCLRKFDQLQNTEPFTEQFYNINDEINLIIGKSNDKNYKQSILLEKEEEKLNKIILIPDNLKNRILKLNADDEIKAKLLVKYREMLSYPSDSSLHLSVREEIEWGLKMPYQMKEEDNMANMNNKQLNKYFCHVRSELDKELYGMDKVKDRILHILNDRRTSGDMCGRNLALVGPPGTGKTKICKVLGKILNKNFVKISAGALDSAALKGTNKVWQGSEPSIVLQKLAEIGTNNCIMLFDEIDKLGNTPQGKLSQHALLHIADTDNNNGFQDNYLKNFSHDLSNVFFIYTMNEDDCIDSALKDRFDIVYLNEYPNEDKMIISKKYMLPVALKTVGLKPKSIKITDKAIELILKSGTYSLRTVEKIIKNIVGKINMYRSVILPDGSVGKLSLPYKIPNFKLPLTIDHKLIKELTSDIIDY